MSIPSKTKINCPKCGDSFSTTIWDSINTDLFSSLALKVVSGEFFNTKCPHCGFIVHLEYDMLYHDIKNNVMIWVLHHNNADYRKKLDEVKHSPLIPGYQTRIVSCINELREKVAALESGKDDRIVELCKFFLKYKAMRHNPDFNVRSMFYTIVDSKDIVFFYDKDGNKIHCFLKPDLHRSITTTFSPALSCINEPHFAIYDAKWAETFFVENIPEDNSNEVNPESVSTDKAGRSDKNAPSVAPIERGKVKNSDSIEKDEIFVKSCLLDNPFYILNVACSDNRRMIASAADERSLLYDSDICSNAQNILITPAKRLTAELSWFIDSNPETIKYIRGRIDSNSDIFIKGLSAISELNALLHNYSISTKSELHVIGNDILKIDKQYSILDSENLCKDINSARRSASITEVSRQEVSSEISKLSGNICQTINKRLNDSNVDFYVELITFITEKSIAADSYDNGVIISGLIDLYEIRMQSVIEEHVDDIEKHIDRIKHLDKVDAIGDNVNSLIRKVQKWDKLAQPLQIKSKASGMPHQISEHLAMELRELAFYICNEKDEIESAFVLVAAMKTIFAELGTFAELFETDVNTLNNILKSKKETDTIFAEFNSLKEYSKSLITSLTNSFAIDDFISRVKDLDSKIKQLDLDEELKIKIRENLCYMARGTAVDLHNTKQETKFALDIIEALLSEFNDMISLRVKLTEDMNLMKQQLHMRSVFQAGQNQQESIQNTNGTRKLVVFGIIMLIVIIFLVIDNTSYNTSPPNTSSSNFQAQITDNNKSAYSGNVSTKTNNATDNSTKSSSRKTELERQITTLKSQIDAMESDLNNLKNDIDDMEWDLESLNSDLETYKLQYSSTGNEYYRIKYNNTVEEYNNLYQDYSDMFEEFKDLSDDYSKLITEHNDKVSDFNTLY